MKNFYGCVFIFIVSLLALIMGGIGGTIIYYRNLQYLQSAVNNSYRTEVIKMFKDICSEKDCQIIYKK